MTVRHDEVGYMPDTNDLEETDVVEPAPAEYKAAFIFALVLIIAFAVYECRDVLGALLPR